MSSDSNEKSCHGREEAGQPDSGGRDRGDLAAGGGSNDHLAGSADAWIDREVSVDATAHASGRAGALARAQCLDTQLTYTDGAITFLLQAEVCKVLHAHLSFTDLFHDHL